MIMQVKTYVISSFGECGSIFNAACYSRVARNDLRKKARNDVEGTIGGSESLVLCQGYLYLEQTGHCRKKWGEKHKRKKRNENQMLLWTTSTIIDNDDDYGYGIFSEVEEDWDES